MGESKESVKGIKTGGVRRAPPVFESLAQVVQRIDRSAIDPDLEVAVDAGGAAGAARLGDHLALVDLLSH